MTVPLLTLVTDRATARMPLLELARQSIDGGVDMVQIREGDLNDSDLTTLVSNIVDAVGAAHVSVNNAPKIAARFGTCLHMPERTMSEFEPIEGPSTISCSVHSVHSLMSVPSSAAYVIAGHLFPSATHPALPPIGANGLRTIVGAASQPVVAIGGITPDNAAVAITNGAAGIAVMSYVNSAREPKHAARALRDGLERTMSQSTLALSVQVNGKPTSIEVDTTLSSFLRSRNLHPRLVVIERNHEIVAKAVYDSTVLEEGDLLEIAHFVGGG